MAGLIWDVWVLFMVWWGLACLSGNCPDFAWFNDAQIDEENNDIGGW
jgi:hypothetical protein